MGYSPWGCKESDTTEQLTLSLPFQWLECFLPSGYEKAFQVHPTHFPAPDQNQPVLRVTLVSFSGKWYGASQYSGLLGSLCV